MFKNIGSQKLIIYAYDSVTNLPKTGDAANITGYVSKDYGAVTILGDTSATELDATNAKGYYLFDLAQAETNADTLLFTAISSTANIIATGSPAVVFTLPPNFTTQSIDASGRMDVIKIAGTTQVAPGASGGLLISGSNSGTTTLAALTVTGSFTVSDGLLVSRSTSNTSAITATGNGTGSGIIATSGSGVTGDGIQATAVSTNGNGFSLVATGTGSGFKTTGGGTGHGILSTGGATSGDGLKAIGGGAGHGVTAQAVGMNVHGLNAIGGSSGTSHGVQMNGAAGAGLRVLSAGSPGIQITATGNTQHGISSTGSNASGAVPAGSGALFTGGASTTNAGGVAGQGIKCVGGTGSASTNGAGDGVLFTGGGTTTVSGGNGLNATATGSAAGILTTGGITGNITGSIASVTGLTASDVGAIKAKTDSLTFTVAGQVDGNARSMNSSTVNGSGTSGDLWRGA